LVPDSADFFSELTLDYHVRPTSQDQEKAARRNRPSSRTSSASSFPRKIAVARAHGDLSENAEYKYAKERQGYVNLKIGHLKKRMGDLSMLNLSNIPKDRSGYGSRIVVLDVSATQKSNTPS